MQFDPEKITFFGRTDARGKNVAFGIKAKDRQKHVYVIGKTGMGKSTLLENMAVQDIQNGEGMAFIDPHGSAAETLLNYIPEHRIKDVLYFAPADAAYPVSFNIMEDVGPDKRHLVVSGLMSVFKKIWVDAWSARMEYILQNTILALLETPGSTLVGVNRMLSDKEYRNLIVKNVKDPGVRSFWVDEFAKYNERYMQEAGDAIKNKIGQFTANPIIRNIIGQPKSSFDLRQMMDDRKIIIMNLSKGLIGETNANLLGSMLTTRIYLAAMSRADLSLEKMRAMPNFYFYVDEFQSFANATFANILSEARKYHLNLTIAHQYIEQMEEDVRNAVFGNVGTIIAFRVGPFDAEVLETIFTPQFLATDIVNLGFAQVYLTLMIDGIGSQPFSATTLPPIAPQTVSYRDMVIGASRAQYARERAAVEVEIEKFHEPILPEPKKEREPRFETTPRSTDGGGYAKPREVRAPAPEQRSEAPRASFPSRQSENRGEYKPHRAFEVNSSPASALNETTASTPPPTTISPPVLTPSSLPSPTTTSAPAVAFERRDRRDSRSGKRHEQRDPARQERRTSEVSPVQKSENVEDLRSVLRKIVSEEQRKESERDAEKPKEQQPEKSNDARSALREALAHAVAPQPTPSENSAFAQVEQVSVRAPHRQEAEHTGRTQNTHTVSPRELERMMRITTSDKPPI